MTRFPKGTVTFLCAKIPSADRRPATMLRTATTFHGGVVFHTTATTLMSGFSAPLPALVAALQIYRHIVATEDLAGPALALHLGPTYERDGRYFGPTLNRVLSILDAAHAGQVLISAAVHDAIQLILPPDVQFQLLGEYRLKDLLRSAQIYQVVAPGLPDQFGPLHTLDVRPHNLPIQDSPLIGREQEVTSICALLRNSATRLLTLLGSSGMGKTRLALQVAVEVSDDFADGVYFVALAPVSDPTLLVSMIAQVLGVKERAGQALLETLVLFLQSKQVLLVLDNFEQLWAAAPTILELLSTTRHVKVLVTSQVALELEPEQVFAVPPLAMPDSTGNLSVDDLSQIPAVALFIERARDVQPTFTLTALMAPAVIELCMRLEGLPLAIELVAAQSQRYFPGDMLVLLQNRLSVARTIRRGNTREDTLRPVLDWICEVLGAGVAGFFARLGVFAGGCTSESAKQICNPTNDLGLDVDQTLTVLLENHLLLREELKEGHIRYTMLDAIHDYAEQRLTRRREGNRLQQTHAGYYTTLAETAEPLLKGPDQQTWLARLDDEHHNLRAAMKWALDNQAERALRLGGALGRFWYMHGHYTEGRQWLQTSLDQAPTAPPEIRAAALTGLGMVTFSLSEYDQAQTAFEQALALRRELNDRTGIGTLLNALATVAMERGEYVQATSLYQECLALWRELDDRWGIATTLNNLGLVLFNQAEIDRAANCFNEGVALREVDGNTWGLAISLSNLGRVAEYQGDYQRASQMLSRALGYAQEVTDERIQARIFEYQARVSLAQGDLLSARRLLTDSIRMRQRLGEKYELVNGLQALAELLLAEGQLAPAARALGAIVGLRQLMGTPGLPLELIQAAATTERIQNTLSQASFDAAWELGRTMPLGELLDELLSASVAQL